MPINRERERQTLAGLDFGDDTVLRSSRQAFIHLAREVSHRIQLLEPPRSGRYTVPRAILTVSLLLQLTYTLWSQSSTLHYTSC